MPDLLLICATLISVVIVARAALKTRFYNANGEDLARYYSARERRNEAE